MCAVVHQAIEIKIKKRTNLIKIHLTGVSSTHQQDKTTNSAGNVQNDVTVPQKSTSGTKSKQEEVIPTESGISKATKEAKIDMASTAAGDVLSQDEGKRSQFLSCKVCRKIECYIM